jgi:hypothetical protein
MGYMEPYFFIQMVHAGAALGGVFIGVQQLQFWGTGWVRWDDVAQVSVWERASGVDFFRTSEGRRPVYHMNIPAARNNEVCARGALF